METFEGEGTINKEEEIIGDKPLEKVPKDDEESENIIEDRRGKIKGFFFSWVEDNYDKLFLLILTLAFIIRIWVFTNTLNQPIWWDAADYLSTAKTWAGLNSNFLDTWYYRRGFFWPLFSSLFFRFGLGETSIRFSVILFSTGIVALSYFLIKEIFNKELAIYTSIITTLSWVFLFFSGRPLTSLPATFFLLLSLLFFWKGYVKNKGIKYMYLFGAFYAIAALTRMQFLLFSLPLIIFVFTKEKFSFLKNKSLWKSIGIFFIIFSPLIFVYYQHYGNPATDILNYYFRIGGISQTGELGGSGDFSKLFDYFTNLPYALSRSGFVLFIIGLFYFLGNLFLGIDKIFKNPKIQKGFFIFAWIVTNFLVLGYITENVEQRYMMPSLAFLFMISSIPLVHVRKLLTEKLNMDKMKALYLVAIVLTLLLIPGFLFAGDLIEQKKTSYLEVKQSGEWIKENSNPEDLVLSASMPQTTYYAERPTNKLHLAYRRDIPKGNETEFYNYVESERPRYLILSVFEVRGQPEWVLNYPQNNPDRVTPVKVYSQGEQTVLIIYEFNYDSVDSSESLPLLSEPNELTNNTDPN